MGAPPPSDGRQERGVSIFAPNAAVKAEFEENFDTYVAFMKAFRDAWDEVLAGFPAAVTEKAPAFANFDSSGGSVPQGLKPPTMAKYDFFKGEVDKLIDHALTQTWIRPI